MSREDVSVLGIDLGSRWSTTGWAVLSFCGEHITECDSGVFEGSRGVCTAGEMADAIDRLARSRNCRAVSIDGPHGWRDPAREDSFCGRLSEKETRTPGKTGVFGQSFPMTWINWITFSTEVFANLFLREGVYLANDPTGLLEAPDGGYLLVECFPTSIWRSSGIKPLAGHHITREMIQRHADLLVEAYGLPDLFVRNHDQLQAIVSALPAVALCGGPLAAIPRGVPAYVFEGRFVEGLIWDCSPRRGIPTRLSVTTPRRSATPSRPLPITSPQKEANLID